MKFLLIPIFVFALATSTYAGSCQDIQESANAAIQARNNRVSESHNTVMPDPESEREGLFQCLGTINAIGDVFTLGVSLPDFEDVISGMCKAADSYIQQKINEVHNQVLNEVNNIGGGNLLKVYGTDEYIFQLTGKLK
ncbi:MAG: hypothetical protein K1W05_04985 [Desulfovibrio sp.]